MQCDCKVVKWWDYWWTIACNSVGRPYYMRHLYKREMTVGFVWLETVQDHCQSTRKVLHWVKLRSCQSKPKFKCDKQILQNYEDIDWINKANRNTAWKDTFKEEMHCINLHKIFEDAEKVTVVLKEHKDIQVHFICNIKYERRYCTRLVVGTYLTDIPVDSVCSGVVFLCRLWKCVWATSIQLPRTTW